LGSVTSHAMIVIMDSLNLADDVLSRLLCVLLAAVGVQVFLQGLAALGVLPSH